MIATKSWVIDLLKKFNKKKDVYSTDEVQIGTWVDGKPIYRKVIIGTSSGTTNVSGNRHHISVGGYDFIDTLINGYGVIGNYSIPAAASNSENKVAYSASITSKGGLNLFSDSSDRFINLPYHYYIEYTKTTD